MHNIGKPGAIYGTALKCIDFKGVIKSIVLEDFPILNFLFQKWESVKIKNFYSFKLSSPHSLNWEDF